MKIAVISDIHGNMEALSSVLDDIKQNGCEKIFVLGDYAMAGPEPAKVINFFREKNNVSKYVMIQGNTDLMIASYTDRDYDLLKTKAPVMAEALKYNSQTLTPTQKMFLQSLPPKLSVEAGGVKFLLVHGSPRKNNEDILPDTSLADVEKMIKNVQESVILCGHTHIPCGFQTESKKTVVNVGSVGRPFTAEPQACYLLIDAEFGRCVFSHRFVEYDKETAAKKLSKQNFKGSDKLAKTLLNPTERHF